VFKRKTVHLQAPPRVVFDTNIFVSGFFPKKGTIFKILKAWQEGKCVVISSPKIIEEIVRVLNYPKIQKIKPISGEEIEELVAAILELAVVVPGKIRLAAIREDPEDNKFLEAAIEGQADYILSGDEHLLNLKEFGKVRILTAKEFLNKTLS